MKKSTQRQKKKSGTAKKVLIGFLAVGLIGSFGKTPEVSTASASSAAAFSEVSVASVDLQNGLAEGMAHLDFPDVGTYEGNLQDGKRSGNGTLCGQTEPAMRVHGQTTKSTAMVWSPRQMERPGPVLLRVMRSKTLLIRSKAATFVVL